MKIKDLLVICNSQIDGSNDEYAEIWKDIRDALEAIPFHDIQAIMGYVGDEQISDLEFNPRSNHIGHRFKRIKKWLEGCK